jgi:acyl phosphate:glycerol-3-phosphate acyltransferase
VRALGLVASYLIGAIPVGFLVARAAGGFDIRGKGSGSIGATNVLRTLGPVPAVLTLLGDVVKGYLAVRVAEVLGPEPAWGAAGALLAVVGNCWPVFLRFRGGKGMATALGAFLTLVPKAVLPAAVLFIAIVAISRYVSLASIAAVLVLPVGAFVLGYPRASTGAAALAALVILWRHRENIRRLADGKENRLGGRLPAA